MSSTLTIPQGLALSSAGLQPFVILADQDNHAAEDHETIPSVYLVLDLLHLRGSCYNARVLELPFCAHPGHQASRGTFSYTLVDGDVKSNVFAPGNMARASAAVHDPQTPLLSNLVGWQCRIVPNPSAEEVLQSVHGGRCPVPCVAGWVQGSQVETMLPDYIRPAPPLYHVMQRVRAVCPVCMGPSLTREHQSLRADAEEDNWTDAEMGRAFAQFRINFNQMASVRGYPHSQRAENEWIDVQDDVDSDEDEDEDENENEDEDDDDDDTEVTEMVDAAGNLTILPALDDTIAGVAEARYAEDSDPGTACPICQEEINRGDRVFTLGCSHIFCGGDCIQRWLAQKATCPVCRRALCKPIP
ncbi:hypothetical protein MBLNU230_g8010t1 [Neophaeotheca triangularis]